VCSDNFWIPEESERLIGAFAGCYKSGDPMTDALGGPHPTPSVNKKQPKSPLMNCLLDRVAFESFPFPAVLNDPGAGTEVRLSLIAPLAVNPPVRPSQLQ